jgi:hypothetical protein
MKPQNLMHLSLFFSSIILNLLLMTSGFASSGYLPPDDWLANLENQTSPPTRRFPIGANSGTFHPELRGLSPSDGPKPRKIRRDPLLSFLQENRKKGAALPTTEGTIAPPPLTTEAPKEFSLKRPERFQGTPWQRINEIQNRHSNGGSIYIVPVGLNASQAGIALDSDHVFPRKPTGVNLNLGVLVSGDLTEDPEEDPVAKHMTMRFDGDLFIGSQPSSLGGVTGRLFGGIQILFSQNQKNEEKSKSRFGVAGGIQGDLDANIYASQGGTAVQGVVTSFGPDLQRLFFRDAKRVVSFQFLPSFGFYSGDYEFLAPLPNGTETRIETYEDRKHVQRKNFGKFRYGVVGKMVIRPGVLVDVLWLRRASGINTNYPDSEFYSTDEIASGMISGLVRGDVIIRLGKRLNLNGSYRWTSFEDTLTDRAGSVTRRTVNIQQTKVGLTVFLNSGY